MNKTQKTKEFQVVGVGAGVFNLSLAALLESNDFRDVAILEKSSDIGWHSGLLFADSEIQVSYLKDLVTPVDPTNRFSFLNYLHSRKLLYQFLNRNSSSVSRVQFQEYFKWVAAGLKSLQFNCNVSQITYQAQKFVVETTAGNFSAQHLVLAPGIVPQLPKCIGATLGQKVFHSSSFLNQRRELKGKRIVVVGGGQSGAEVVHNIISGESPESLHWLTRRSTFAPLEDSSFTNEFFNPSFVRTFMEWPKKSREHCNEMFRMASDGINIELIGKIYRTLFEQRFFSDRACKTRLVTSSEMISIKQVGTHYQLTFNRTDTGVDFDLEADVVILATGYSPGFPALLQPILGTSFSSVESLVLNNDFSLQWENGDRNKIFIQNGVRAQVGPVDPNLSIAAWRSGMIVNSLLGKERYSFIPDQPFLDF